MQNSVPTTLKQASTYLHRPAGRAGASRQLWCQSCWKPPLDPTTHLSRGRGGLVLLLSRLGHVLLPLYLLCIFCPFVCFVVLNCLHAMESLRLFPWWPVATGVTRGMWYAAYTIVEKSGGASYRSDICCQAFAGRPAGPVWPAPLYLATNF